MTTESIAGVRAVILAGGTGVRLHPFGITFPKALMPLGHRPVLEILINHLVTFGISDITLTLDHLAELVKAYFDNYTPLVTQVRLRYVQEDKPMGTAGALRSVPDLNETFLVLNADLLTDLDFNALLSFHRRQGAALTIAAHHRRVKIDLGVLERTDDYRVIGYHEKPEYNYKVSMGACVYEPSVLQLIKPGRYLGFPDLVPKLIAAGEKVCAMPCDCLWLDIGQPDDYNRAQEIYNVPVHQRSLLQGGTAGADAS
jgi:NDP-sugar pyrophosphorylase family protein